MRGLDTSLQQFGEFLLRPRLVREKAAPHCVRWVRPLLMWQASDEPLADQDRRFCEDLERNGRVQDHLCHAHVETTTFCRHVVKELCYPSRNPFDLLKGDEDR